MRLLPLMVMAICLASAPLLGAEVLETPLNLEEALTKLGTAAPELFEPPFRSQRQVRSTGPSGLPARFLHREIRTVKLPTPCP